MDGESRTATSTFTQLLRSDTREFSSVLLYVDRDHTSTETIRTIRDGEPRTATTISTQLLSSDSREFQFNIFYVHRDHRDY